MNHEDIYAAAREEYRKVILAQAAEIASLSKRVEWFTHAVHTCHAECDRPLCKATRRNDKLRAALEEAIEYADQDYLTPAGEAMVNRWRALVKRESDEG